MKQSLKIQDYEVYVHLGCSTEEQKFLQPVHFSLVLDFEKNLNGADNDQLSDAVDYVELTEILKKKSLQKKYHLIEHLCSENLKAVAIYLKEKSVKGELSVEVQKIRVPIESMRGGVFFKCKISV